MQLFVIIVSFLVAAAVIYFLKYVYTSWHLPPGPFALPIIGNLHLLSEKVYKDLHKISLHYGPVYRLWFGSSMAIIINSYYYAKEAMIQKGSAFAGRPYHYGGSLFSRNGKGVGFQDYNPRLKLQRKAIIHTIRRFEKRNLEEMIIREVEEVISRLESYPNTQTSTMTSKDLRESINDAENYLVAVLSLGENLKKTGQDFSNIIDTLAVFSEGLAASNIIEAFPFLKYFPMGIIQRMKKACEERDMILDKKFRLHKERFFQKNELEGQDLTDVLLEMSQKKKNVPDEELSDDNMIMTINDTIMAGTESSTSSLCWVIYFLVKHPLMQTKIQKQLDDIIGPNRKPMWNDRQQLPYLSAFITESMRMASVMPLALPHQSIMDTTIGPYKVPKGTTVILNLYGVHNDPVIWHKPRDFNPQRFLHQDGTFNKETASKCLAFGLGHRVCPGELLARMELFLFVSRLLQSFTFRCYGELPDIDNGSFGLVYRSPEFKMTIKKRLNEDYIVN